MDEKMEVSIFDQLSVTFFSRLWIYFFIYCIIVLQFLWSAVNIKSALALNVEVLEKKGEKGLRPA